MKKSIQITIVLAALVVVILLTSPFMITGEAIFPFEISWFWKEPILSKSPPLADTPEGTTGKDQIQQEGEQQIELNALSEKYDGSLARVKLFYR